MALNFKIIRHSNSDNLHLRLTGIFDGTSAMELIHTIRDNLACYHKIFIHTCGLSACLPFGEAVFMKNCTPGVLKTGKLVFTGDFGDKMALYTPLPETNSSPAEQELMSWQ